MDIFIDILTVPQYSSFEQLEEKKPISAQVWHNKHGKENYSKLAGLYSEYNRIAAIGYGYSTSTKTAVKSIGEESSEDLLSEYGILVELIKVLASRDKSGNIVFNRFAGLNVTTFDIPLLYRKCMQYGLLLPYQLEIVRNAKPWDMPVLEVGKLYNGGFFNNDNFGGNIDVLSELFELPTLNICTEEVVSTVSNYGENWSKIETEYVERNVNNTIEIWKKLTQN